MKNKNSIIGFLLIGLVLILFSWYQTRQAGRQAEEERRIRDSLALVNPPQETAPVAEDAATLPVGETAVAEPAAALFNNQYLESAYQESESIYRLENSKLAIEFTSKGAQPCDVLIKDYFKYDSTDIHLLSPGHSTIQLEFNSIDQYVELQEFNWQCVSADDYHIVFRLPFGESAWIDAVYNLPADSYMLDYELHFVGMDRYLARGTTQMTLGWAADLPRMEKGYKNERNYSAVAYRNGGASGDVKTIGQRKESVHETFPTRLRWIGFQPQFFSAILVADNEFAGGEISNKFYPEGQADGMLMHSWAKLGVEIDPRSADFSIPMHFYFGPNHFPTLKSYGEKFEKIIPLGGKIIGSISRYVIIPIFNWLSRSIASYGLIILLLTLIIKLVIFPLTYRSYASSAKMQLLKPEVDKINARYPKQEDAMKKSQATMDLYKKAGVSMFGGCLPILLQFPILWAMFRFFPASFELRQQPFLWAEDLSTYDSILNFGFNIPLYGDHISLFALLMGISMWAYSKMTMPNTDTSSMPGMKFMQVWMMPIMMVFLCNNFSAGLSYYYLLSNIITIIQNVLIRRSIDKDKFYAQLQRNMAKPEKKKKSGFRARLDEMYRQQQQQQRK